jgi:hypothetical protein
VGKNGVISANFYMSPVSMMLPYFEQKNLQTIYNFQREWHKQLPSVAQTVIPIFNCPSNLRSENPAHNALIEGLIPTRTDPADPQVGGTFALMDRRHEQHIRHG